MLTVTAAGQRMRVADGSRTTLRVVGQRRRPDRYVRTRVEQLDRVAPVTCCPLERYTEQPDRGSTAMSLEVLRKSDCVSSRVEVVVGLEGPEIADEEGVTTALYVNESRHESIVRVEAACEDNR